MFKNILSVRLISIKKISNRHLILKNYYKINYLNIPMYKLLKNKSPIKDLTLHFEKH